MWTNERGNKFHRPIKCKYSIEPENFPMAKTNPIAGWGVFVAVACLLNTARYFRRRKIKSISIKRNQKKRGKINRRKIKRNHRKRRWNRLHVGSKTCKLTWPPTVFVETQANKNNSSTNKFTIAVDLSFEDKMSELEIRSLCKQLQVICRREL